MISDRPHLPRSLFVLLMMFLPVSLYSQDAAEESSSKQSLNLFMDCFGCDMNYIRTEMPYINFVREVRDAQVYLMITRQPTGSGGTRWTLFYNGQEKFAGMKDTLTYDSSQDDTFDVTRTALTNSIAMGLMRYLAKTPIRNNLMVKYSDATRQEPEQEVDNWNHWVFEINTEPELMLEKSEEQYSWRNSFRVNRVTADWKILNNFNHNYRKNYFYSDVVDSETGEVSEMTTEAVRKSWGISNLTVKSLGNHWSAGVRGGASSSTFSNIDLKLWAAPAVEYNIFPYSESNQRQLVFLYGMSMIYNNYNDTTIFNKTTETLLEQTLDISLQVQQKWGNANISLGASNYMHDFSKNSVALNGFLRVRILRGLSLFTRAGIEFLHNQVELTKGGHSAEDVYLRLRELQTNYRFDASLGLSYTFGSIYNNIVNPRF